MGSETREIVMAFSREFGETESPPRWDMKMERCLGRWLKGPLFLFELQSEVVMRNRLVLLAALMWCLSGVAAAAPAMDIVLYPSSAQVQVDDTLPVKNGAVTFVVPAGTDLESLVISLDKGEVISRRAIPVLVADSETVAALRQDLAEARAHAAGLEGEAAAVAARISLWSKGALAQEISMAEMEKLDAVMPERLDLNAMRRGAALLTGEHDFSAFCGNARMKKSTVRRIDSIDIRRQGEEIQILFTGNGFLYNMVRILVGTLVEVGRGERETESIPSLFGGKREDAGFLAPADCA